MVIEGTFQDAKELVMRLTVDEAFHRYKDRVFSAAFIWMETMASAIWLAVLARLLLSG